MTDTKDTAPVRPRRDTDKDSGPVGENEVRLAYNGKSKEASARMGKGILLFIGSILLSLGTALGIVGSAANTKEAVKEAVKEAAPDPQLVQGTARDVGQMKDAMVSLASDVKVLINDKDAMQKQLDQQQQDIRELQRLVPTAREMEDIRNRLKRLEDERAK